jgi:DNA excision repair protein ERCC-3
MLREDRANKKNGTSGQGGSHAVFKKRRVEVSAAKKRAAEGS